MDTSVSSILIFSMTKRSVWSSLLLFTTIIIPTWSWLAGQEAILILAFVMVLAVEKHHIYTLVSKFGRFNMNPVYANPSIFYSNNGISSLSVLSKMLAEDRFANFNFVGKNIKKLVISGTCNGIILSSFHPHFIDSNGSLKKIGAHGSLGFSLLGLSFLTLQR